MNPLDLLDLAAFFDAGRPGAAAPRRYPAYRVSSNPLTGEIEVESNEPGGSQRATWTTWGPGTPPRNPTLTKFEHPGRREPTEEFKALIDDLRARNDPGPVLSRTSVTELG